MQGMDEIAALLHIHREATASGNLNNIANAAYNELRKINEDMGQASERPAHSLPGEPPRDEPPPGDEPPPAPKVGSITVGGSNG